MESSERLIFLGEILAQKPTNNDFDLYCRRLDETTELYRAQKPSISSQPAVIYSYLTKFSNVLVFAYGLLDDVALDAAGNQGLLKSISRFQDLLLDDAHLQLPDNENDLDPSDISNLAIALGHLASKADRFDLRVGFRAWKFFSQFLSIFRQQLEVAFSGEHVPRNNKCFRCDYLIESLLISAQENFNDYLVELDASPRTTRSNSEPIWRSKLKLVAFICRLFVGCLRQFTVYLFLPTTGGIPRAAIKFIEWTLGIKHAGGLFRPVTGLPEYLLKDLETTVFVALSVSLSSISLIPNYPEHVASAAAIAVAKSDIPPLIKCRIFLGILDGLSQQSDTEPFALWMCDDFNIYLDLFKNAKAAISPWNPHGSFQSSHFAIPKCLNFNPDSNVIASSVEQFLTDVSVEVCRSARSLTTEFFPFLETALLDTVLHSSPVISLVAQDIWCFLARYGSADLCWQYVTLLGNAIVCLAERYEAGTGPMPPRAPLRQLSRLGNLLSRLTVFLTARQQREFLSFYPLSDRQTGGAADKSILWRFLNLRLPLFHPSVRALLERQLLERLDHLLTQSPSTAWMLDALVCLAISQDLSSTLLASNAASLSGLSIKILMGSTVGESQSSQTSSSQVSSCPASSLERTPLAAPHLLHLTDYPLRVEAVAACISRWIPRLPQFCGRGDLEEEPFKLLQLILRELQTACRNGLSYTGLDALSRWLLNLSSPRQQVAAGENSSVASSMSSTHSLPAFTVASTSLPLSPLSKPVNEQHSQWLAPALHLLSRTTTKNSEKLAGWLAGKIKERLLDLSPSLKDITADPSIVDQCLNDLSVLISRLEKQGAFGFSVDQLTRGSQLSDRLAVLFLPSK
uniref:Uncharacterized protein C1orf112 homolog n=1 Tax=Schistocephalus solidus TaxID=70667 RepID=A0A0X3Q5Z2_SCHSO